MQTFMPYPNFKKSIKCLDYRRLGKQRIEAKQILDILLNRTKKKGWRNHPAIKMWKGYENALKLYYNLCLDEWINRDYKNTMLHEQVNNKSCIMMPYWFGNMDFHRSHMSNLLRKNRLFYSQYNWIILDNLPYIWPKGKEEL